MYLIDKRAGRDIGRGYTDLRSSCCQMEDTISSLWNCAHFSGVPGAYNADRPSLLTICKRLVIEDVFQSIRPGKLSPNNSC